MNTRIWVLGLKTKLHLQDFSATAGKRRLHPSPNIINSSLIHHLLKATYILDVHMVKLVQKTNGTTTPHQYIKVSAAVASTLPVGHVPDSCTSTARGVAKKRRQTRPSPHIWMFGATAKDKQFQWFINWSLLLAPQAASPFPLLVKTTTSKKWKRKKAKENWKKVQMRDERRRRSRRELLKRENWRPE